MPNFSRANLPEQSSECPNFLSQLPKLPIPAAQILLVSYIQGAIVPLATLSGKPMLLKKGKKKRCRAFAGIHACVHNILSLADSLLLFNIKSDEAEYLSFYYFDTGPRTNM